MHTDTRSASDTGENKRPRYRETRTRQAQCTRKACGTRVKMRKKGQRTKKERPSRVGRRNESEEKQK